MKLIFMLFGYVIFHHQFMLKFRLAYTCHISMNKARTYRRSLLKFLSRVSLNATHPRWFYLFHAFHYFTCFCTEIYFPRLRNNMLSRLFLRPASHANEICENSSSDNLVKLAPTHVTMQTYISASYNMQYIIQWSYTNRLKVQEIDNKIRLI